MKTAVIISNGGISQKITFEDQNNFIVAVDGGYSCIRKQKLKCGLVIGDLDSIAKSDISAIRKSGIELLRFPKDKDYTDTELAIKEMIKRGFGKIILIGVIGKRIDHTLANILLLEKYSDSKAEIKIIDNNNEIAILKNCKKAVGKSKKYKYISFISLTDFSTLSLTGFKYNLKNKKIRRGDTLCVSNEQKGAKAEVTVHKGKILMIRSRD